MFCIARSYRSTQASFHTSARSELPYICDHQTSIEKVPKLIANILENISTVEDLCGEDHWEERDVAYSKVLEEFTTVSLIFSFRPHLPTKLDKKMTALFEEIKSDMDTFTDLCGSNWYEERWKARYKLENNLEKFSKISQKSFRLNPEALETDLKTIFENLQAGLDNNAGLFPKNDPYHNDLKEQVQKLKEVIARLNYSNIYAKTSSRKE